MIRFAGKKLLFLRDIADLAISEIRTQIGAHPEPLNYPEDIEELEKMIAALQRLQARIDRSMARESATPRRA